MSDRANKNLRAALHARHASPPSRKTLHVAHRTGKDEWPSRQLLAERAWTQRSVLGGPFADGVRYPLPTVIADAFTGGYAAERMVGSA